MIYNLCCNFSPIIASTLHTELLPAAEVYTFKVFGTLRALFDSRTVDTLKALILLVLDN